MQYFRGNRFKWLMRTLLMKDQPLVLKLHILAGPVLVFAVGMTVAGHVRRHWGSASRRGRRTGYPLTFLIAPLVLSGYLLQAFTDERWLQVLGYVHLGLGLLFIGWFAGHRAAAAVRSRRRTNRGQPSAVPVLDPDNE
jgi:hypothetical protein